MVDLSGMAFGKLTVIERAQNGFDGRAWWMCLCQCGKKHLTSGKRLRAGITKSCGCLHTEQVSRMGKNNITHGMSKTRTWVTWESVRERCLNPNNNAWKDYGGRGIKICKRWDSFENFLADMGERPIGKTIDRVNNNGNYEPSNCRWATSTQQNRNKRNNRLFGGITAAEWSERTGVNYVTLRKRLIRQEAKGIFTIPVALGTKQLELFH